MIIDDDDDDDDSMFDEEEFEAVIFIFVKQFRYSFDFEELPNEKSITFFITKSVPKSKKVRGRGDCFFENLCQISTRKKFRRLGAVPPVVGTPLVLTSEHQKTIC